MTTHQTEWVAVISTGDPFVIALGKSLLDEASIPYITMGETLQDMIGPGRFGLKFNQVAGPVEIVVPEDYLEEALLVCSDIDKSESKK